MWIIAKSSLNEVAPRARHKNLYEILLLLLTIWQTQQQNHHNRLFTWHRHTLVYLSANICLIAWHIENTLQEKHYKLSHRQLRPQKRVPGTTDLSGLTTLLPNLVFFLPMYEQHYHLLSPNIHALFWIKIWTYYSLNIPMVLARRCNADVGNLEIYCYKNSERR